MLVKTLLAALSDRALRRLLVVVLPVDAWCVWHAVSGAGSWLPAAFAGLVTVAVLADAGSGERATRPELADDGALRPPAARSGERLLWRGIRAMRVPDADGARSRRGAPLALEAASAPDPDRGRRASVGTD